MSRSPLLLLVACLLLGCSQDKEAQERPSGSSGGSSSSAGAGRDSAGCLARQGRFVARVSGQLQRVVVKALSQPNQAPTDVAEPFVTAVQDANKLSQVEIPQWKTPRCPHPPLAMARLLELSDEADSQVPSRALLRQTVKALQAWARKVGHPAAARVVFAADPCQVIRHQVKARYAVRYRTSGGTKKGWVDLILSNQSPFYVYADHGGAMLAHGLGVRGVTRRLVWGGSSADGATARSGRTSSTTVYPVWGPSGELPLQSWGSLRVLDFGATVYAGRLACGVPVVPAR